MQLINVLIPFLSTILYLLLIFVVLNSRLNQIKKALLWYLSATAFWSLNSFILHANFFPNYTLTINEILYVGAISWVIAYFYFAAIYTRRVNRIFVISGIVFLAAVAGVTLTDNVILNSVVINNTIVYQTGVINWIIVAGSSFFMIYAITSLVQKYLSSVDPVERNRGLVLLLGIGFNIIFEIPIFFEATKGYPLDHAGNIINALVITYAILRYQLVSMRSLVRQILTYFTVGGTLLGVYIGIVIIVRNYLPDLPISSLIGMTSFAALFLIVIFVPFRRFMQNRIDHFFYRDTLQYRMQLLNFDRIHNNVINLVELADALLPAISKALNVTFVRLFLKNSITGEFDSNFSYPPSDQNGLNELAFDTENPIISWLEKKNCTLEVRQIVNIPELKGLWQIEREQINKAGISLLCPIKNEGELVGVIVLGQKTRGILFTQEDFELIEGISKQTGIIIQNAQRFSQALLKANTDGLTNLYNHRHFHERLEQEIARSSRFGTVFSLMMIDIDMFKSYNDNFGHLSGDEALRRVAEIIRTSVRSIDVACRYGGEEFSVILPETRLADAFTVAERIRKSVERGTVSLAMPLSVSIGIATWPVDGVEKEGLISLADKALYYAKKNGRNRTSLTTEITEFSKIKRDVNEYNPKSLNVIYALAATVDAKDHYTFGHSQKVSEYAVALAEAVNLPSDKIPSLRAAALLHDIGKIGIPDSILNKDGPFLPAEWEPVMSHTRLGVDILRHITDLAGCLPAILYHHERYDGTGYPIGLKGEDIPLEARILSIADSFEAMTTPRPYRREMSSVEAIDELKKCSGTQFDPELVSVFTNMAETLYVKE